VEAIQRHDPAFVWVQQKKGGIIPRLRHRKDSPRVAGEKDIGVEAVRHEERLGGCRVRVEVWSI